MLRVLFLLLIVLGSVAFAQIDENPKPRKFDEFGIATNGKVKMRIDAFMVELGNNPDSQGYILNYGMDRDMEIREKQIRNAIAFRSYDELRITFVRGGGCKSLKTEFWLVPAGAENPPVCSDTTFLKLKPQAVKLEEMGEVSDRFFLQTLNYFFERVKTEKTTNGYILICGSEDETNAFEKRIRELEFFEFYNSERIIFLKKPPAKTQATITLWVVPDGADLPDELNTK